MSGDPRDHQIIPNPDSHLIGGLEISIAGAGIAGLSLAVGLARAGLKNVTVYEASRTLGEVGAALQAAPNATRALQVLGVLEQVRPLHSANSYLSIRRYKDDAELGKAMFTGFYQKYGSPAWAFHRADLHSTLRDVAVANGVTVITSAVVKMVDFEATRLLVERDGAAHWVTADAIFGADGIKSVIRKAIFKGEQEVDHVLRTGDAAYRLLIPRALMIQHPETEKLINERVAHRWIGPDVSSVAAEVQHSDLFLYQSHIMGYPIKQDSLYNMVLVHPDVNAAAESWTSKGTKAELITAFESFCPRVKRLIALAPDDGVLEWSLRGHKPVPHWTRGSVALLGDACHPTLPYVGQGAGQAMEDAVVIAAMFSQLRNKEQIPFALQLYQDLRKTRADRVVASATLLEAVLHHPDGPQQAKRDQEMRDAENGGPNPDFWGNTEWQDEVFGRDVFGEALERAKAELGGAVNGLAS